MIINDLYNNKKSSLSEGMKAQELAMYCEKLVAEKGLDAAYKHAQFMAQGNTDPSWGSVLKYLDAMKQGMAEGQLEFNTPDPVVVVQDLKGNILDKINLSVAAQKYKLGAAQNIKNQLAHQNYTTIGNYVIVSPMSGQPQDATTQGVAEAVGMMIKGAAISGANDQDIADQIAARTGGRVDSGSYGHHILITYPTTQHRAEAAVKIRKMFPGIELYKSGGNRNAIDEQGVAAGSETYKQGHAKFRTKTNKQIGPTHYGRGSDKKADSYTKADPRYHEVRPVKEQGMAEGKRPDTYHIVNKDGKPANLASYADKESAVKDRDAKHQGAEVRQLGPRGKVKGVSEAHDAAAKEIHGNLFHDSIPPGAEKHHVSAVLKAHGLKDTDAKDVIDRVRKMGYTGPRLGKSDDSITENDSDVPVHRIGLTVIDPQHPMVSKRREEYQKTVRVPGHDREQAITAAINHLRRRGFKVLDHHYIGLLEADLGEGWKSALGGAALAGSMALGGGAAQAQNAPSGEDFLPAIVAHVTFKVNGNTVTKDINLGTSFKSPGDASAALEKFLKSKGVKFYEFNLERVSDSEYNNNYLDKTPLSDKGNPTAYHTADKGYTPSDNTAGDYMVKEVSLGDYRKKAALSKATSQMDRFFGRDDPATVSAADQNIAKREKGLARADARSKPYIPPKFDAEKHQRDLTTKYPNIDELVADAERNRDPYYDRAEGSAYYAGREAEQNYQRLKQIQRVIQGLNESLNRSHLP